jgi:hypothetical protein
MGTERVLNMDEMLKRFEFLGAKAPEAVRNAMMVSAEAMLAGVVRKLRGQYLNVRTGHGWQSMQEFTRVAGDSIKAGIDTDVGYMKAHEEGFHGRVQVREHTAHRLGRILAVDVKSRTVSKRARPTKREIARGSWTVRAHDMQMNIRARRFMRDTINEQFDATANRVERALVIAARTGSIPTRAQLAGGGGA